LAAAGIDPTAVREDGPVFSDPGAAFRRWKDTWSAGQGIDAVDRIEPAAAIIERLDAGYRAARA
jgi:nitronate monooxygenase